jgi:hypothetical protein
MGDQKQKQATSLTVHQFPVVEITKDFSKGVSQLKGAGSALQIISGSEAFRKYDWLRKVPGLNRADNLRGMVVSRKWRIVFEQTSEGVQILGKVATIASFAANILEQYAKVENVLQSRDDAFLKGLRLSAIAGTAAERVLIGTVTGLVSAALFSMQGYCRIVGLVPHPNLQSFSNECVDFLENADGKIQTTVKTYADTAKQAEAVYWISSKIKFQ